MRRRAAARVLSTPARTAAAAHRPFSAEATAGKPAARPSSSRRPLLQALPGLPAREAQVARLGSDEDFDVLVVGGGATGCGAALDAQRRGLSTALIERADFGAETSSRSTKLVWAGIRYIATATSQLLRLKNLSRPVDALHDFWGEFSMVLGAHRERRFLLEKQEHLTHWMPIAVPVQSWLSLPAPFGHPLFAVAPLVLPLVMKFYDSLGGFRCPPSHIMGRKRARRKFPQLDPDFKYAQIFYEGMHNDARTNTAIALTAAEEGAAVCNHVEMLELLYGGPAGATATGARCRDTLTGEKFEVKSRAVIFAGGPFTDELRRLEDAKAPPAVAGAAGTHIVLPGYYCPPSMGMLDINTCPTQGATLVGTTDTKGTPVSSPKPPEEDIQWILQEVEKYLSPELRVRRSDVLSAWYGWRPLASDPNAKAGAPVSRDHIISTNPETGTTFITGGKWTTYREMAEDVVDHVVALKGFTHASQCSTLDRVLWGGVGYTNNLPIKLVQRYGVAERTAKHLVETYGARSLEVCEMSEPTGKAWPLHGIPIVEGHPHIECEVKYACMEYTRTVADFLSLRTRLAYVNIVGARAAVPRVTELMAVELGWDDAESTRQLQAAYDHLAEFGGPVPIMEEQRRHGDFKDLFRMFDRDDDGAITLEEMRSAADVLGMPFASDAEAEEAFGKMGSFIAGDRGGIESVSEEQFLRWWLDQDLDDDKQQLRRKIEKRFSINMEGLKNARGVMFG